MTQIRDFNKGDTDDVTYMYRAHKFDYPLPEPDEFLEDLVLTDDSGKVVMRVAALNMVELYFLVDGNYESPGMRFEHFKLLHEAMRQRLALRGVKGAHVFLPPSIAKSFSRRLIRKLGWVKSSWLCLFRRV